MKQTLSWFLVFMILFSSASLIRSAGGKEEAWENPYVDVTQDMWSHQYITELNKAGVLPAAEKFLPTENIKRSDFVQYLYNMDNGVFKEVKKKRERENKTEEKPFPFTDVAKDAAYYDAVFWSYQNDLVGGTEETLFSPDDALSREQICAILARFASLEQLSLRRIIKPDQFMDSIYIQNYARTGVTVCQMSGVVKGYENNFFHPNNIVSREEAATMLYRLMIASQVENENGTEYIDLAAGAYDSLYESYTDIPFTALLPQTPADDLSFFDGAVFIGDSVSLTLESYCNSSAALGKAQFLCAGSMSASNMLSGIILPEYPKGSGQKPPIADSVGATGARVVYVMLGMDNIAFGLEKSTGDMVKVLSGIREQNPNVQIIVQSVTPMADSSTSYSNKLNNGTITAYNAKMQEICQENRWYYLNVAEVFKDANGFLKREYCSDYGKMGMHVNYEGAKVWVEYLKTHVPSILF